MINQLQAAQQQSQNAPAGHNPRTISQSSLAASNGRQRTDSGAQGGNMQTFGYGQNQLQPGQQMSLFSQMEESANRASLGGGQMNPQEQQQPFRSDDQNIQQLNEDFKFRQSKLLNIFQNQHDHRQASGHGSTRMPISARSAIQSTLSNADQKSANQNNQKHLRTLSLNQQEQQLGLEARNNNGQRSNSQHAALANVNNQKPTLAKVNVERDGMQQETRTIASRELSGNYTS